MGNPLFPEKQPQPTSRPIPDRPPANPSPDSNDRFRKILLSVAGVVMTILFAVVFKVIRMEVTRAQRNQQAETQRIEDEQRKEQRAASIAESDAYLKALNEQQLRDPLGKEPPLPIPPGLQAKASEPVDASNLSMQQSIARLRGNDRRQATAAARWLAAQPVDPRQQPQVQTLLLYNLNDGTAEQHRATLAALAVWGNAEAVGEIYDLSAISGELRPAALDALLSMREESAMAAVVKMLGDSTLAPAAAEALLRHGQRAKPHLIARFNDDNMRLRDECRRLLQTMKVSDDEMLPLILRDLESAPGKSTHRTQHGSG